MSKDSIATDPNSIAVIGMSCRMAGASSVDEFWANLAAGRESIRDLGDAQLREAGISPEAASHERYVRRASSLDGVEMFDARFFDFTPREATITAPSQRMLLMCAHEAFEDAGYDPRNCNPNVGVFAGVNRCDDWQKRLYELADTESGEFAKMLQLYIANDLDYAATRISYKFDLKGPSFNVSTACSTSLVAIHQACRALLSYECDMALAGGASVVLPQDAGYIHEPGGIQSHDGRCRAFDASSDGTIFGNGAGVVLLKRLDEAIADRDNIHAVIRGTAINNDGAAKVGYTAPSVQGQSQVILTALELAGVDPSDVGYVEAHGTGTSLGDPIEIEALTRAYRARTRRKRYCAIGSVKTNIGHLGAAAGVAGFIKTVLALKHRQIPASLHYRTPNPEIDFDSSPFVVNTELKPWAAAGQPRIAGLSSFGVGGTNAHAILQEAPSQPSTGSSRPQQLLALSAKSPAALDAQVRRLLDKVCASPELDLPDVAYTLGMGRTALEYRATVVAGSRDEAIAKLAAMNVSAEGAGPAQRSVKLALMFPGQGSQHPNMTLGLYQAEPVFRDTVDRCAALLESSLKRDIRNLLYPRPGREAEADAALQRTENAQPALFVTGYAMAQLLESWGLQADATIGHSIGEYVSACLAGVFSLEDALKLVAERGRLMQTMVPGRMLAVAASEHDIKPLLGDCSLAAVNGPQWCVVSGPLEAMAAFEQRLSSAGRPLHTSHAFHSSTADPILEIFHAVVRRVTLRAPTRRFISNLSGDWIRDSEAVDPAYWVKQLRGTVRFHAGVSTLMREGRMVLLEAGASQSLTALVKSFGVPDGDLVVAPCCRSAKQDASADLSILLQALGRAWTAGRSVDWKAFYAGERRARVSLPTYPFEGQRHWLERVPGRSRAVQVNAPTTATPTSAPAAVAAAPIVPGKSASALVQRLAGTAPEARQSLMEAFVGERVRALLGLSSGDHAGTALVELGLSSLMAIELRTELNAALQADHVSVIQLLDENTNIRTLAAHLLEMVAAGPVASAEVQVPEPTVAANTTPVPEAPVQVEANEFGSAVKSITPDLDSQFLPFPLTEIQQAYWIGRHNAGSGGNVATYAYIETEIRNLDVARYEFALNEMVRRHHMLRMVVQEDGQQRFLPEVPAYRIPVDDLSMLSPQEAEARLLETRDAMSHQVLDPTVWPLFQLRISRITPQRCRLHYGFDFMIVDVLSLLVFFRDMFLLYMGEQDRLTPLQLSYRDYVLAEKANRGSEQFQRSRQYWLDRVPTLAAAPSLPLTCEPSAIAAPRYVRRDFELDRDTWSRLKAQARQYKVTPSVLIATAYSEVLAKWCASPRFTLNLTIFNRPRLHPQMNDLIGDFTSSVLLEVDMSQVEAFESCARNIQNRLMSDLEHRHFSGVETLRALNSQMGGYQAVVMPIVLTSALGLDQHAESRLAGLDESKLQVYEEMMTLGHTISQTSQVWLDHVVREKNGALLCNWDALEEIFPPRMLDEMFCAYYDRLIELASEGEAAWRSLRPVALPHEQQAARDLVNATEAPISNALLQTLFEHQATRTPDALAVVNGDVRLSYRELLVLATHLGRSLREQGARPNELVAVVMEKGWEQIVAVFGILFSGAAYMPVDASLPPERVRHLLQQGEVRIALTQTRLLDRIDWPEAVRAQAIDRQQIDDSWRRRDMPVTLTPVQGPGDLAYVLFTSGSTGVPKGVMIDHRSAVNTVLDINQRFGITPADRAIAINALNFDLSVYDVFGLLSVGGALVMPLAERLLDASHWSELVLAERVTFWNTVPAIVQLYVEELEAQGARGRQPQEAAEALRLVFMSGDWIPVSLPDRIRAVLPAAKPISLGGPTETTVWSIYYPIGRVEPEWKSIPYGKPLANRTHHVLHADLTDCPDWVPGDIYTGGRIGLSQGYWRDEEKTAKVFINHPLTGEPIYKTGDVGRFLPDGNIEFIGRSDHQVKVQGHRIELGEIEHALTHCEGVRDALVMAVSDGAGDAQRAGHRLVAFVVEQASADDDSSIVNLMASEGVLRDPMQRAAFKLTQSHLRAFDEGTQAVALPHAPRREQPLRWSPSACQTMPPASATSRNTASLDSLGLWLSCLAQVRLADAALPKYFYPSAGSAHPVQCYLYVKAGAFSGVAEGCYYHDPAGHRLVRVAPAGAWNAQKAIGPALDACGFALFLVANPAAILPLYGEVGVERFAAIEAGHMLNLLSGSARHAGLAAWTGTAADEAMLLDGLSLPGEHRLVAALFGGGHAVPADLPATPIDCVVRQSYRRYLGDGVKAPQLRQLLSTLVEAQGPRAGTADMPTLWLHVKPGRVEGLAGGLYRVDAATAELELLCRLDSGLGGNLQYMENRPIHAGSAFSVIFMRDQAQATMQQLVQTGHLAQTLLHRAPGLEIGLCSTGGARIDLLRRHVPLADSFEAFYCLEGGSITPQQTLAWDNAEFMPLDPVQAWRDTLRARLPYYMVPSSFVRLKSFPLTANGKVDRKALAQHGMAGASAPTERELAPPRDELESAVHAAWLAVLEIGEAGIHDNLFELGGDSLMATKLTAELARTLGLNLPLHKVFADPTIAGMAAQYRALQGSDAMASLPTPTSPATAQQVLGEFAAVSAQLMRDASQDLPLVIDHRIPGDLGSPKAILLTGANGFLGAHVLHELLKRTSADVFCLVRGKDRTESLRRIEASLSLHGLDAARYRHRIHALAGDLAKPNLGLAADEHAAVCAEVDVIYHLGAQVNYARTYADLKAANVGGARAIISLAATGKRKGIVYVSSKYVCFGLDEHGVAIQQSEDRIARPDGLFIGYTQSKWVAEKLFERAGDAGIPVAIVRPGQISAAAHGRTHLPDDAFHQLVNLFRSVGSRPHDGEWSDGVIDIVPVDYCAAAIAAIGLKAGSYGRHFHLVNPQPMSMDNFFATLRELSTGPAPQVRSFEEWANDCLSAIHALDDKVSAFVLEKFFVATEHGRFIKGLFIDARLSRDNVSAALTGSGITCPAVNVELWRRYLQTGAADGSPPPAGSDQEARHATSQPA
ncbi:non-ribosomal peptide synthetase/type I polyketide synthase [Piscinibacter terrae]|nr:non-ribosomal peptide synthetase/type I polyketide synthase [Albitalea terrae]